jgi:hypothetical protein
MEAFMEAVETFEHNGHKIEIFPDTDARNPRKEFDHVGTVACEHRRYNLGDQDGTSELTDAICKSRDWKQAWNDLDGVDLIVAALPHCTDIIALPLYLYDHSGITMSTGSFSCPWDSGQVGFIFITKADALKEWGKPGQTRMSKRVRDAALACLEAEVKEYDQYLTGDVYGYVIEGDDEFVACCWGFYGLEHCKEAAKEAVA